MKILLRQSGGFAGPIELAKVDTTKLSSAQAQQLKQQLQGADFFNLPSMVSGPESEIGADLLTYEISVDEGKRQHSVKFSDDTSPQTAQLRKLVAALKQFSNS